MRPKTRLLKKPAPGIEVPVSFLRFETVSRVLWISGQKIPVESFPACIKNILSKEGAGGGHRASAVLAAFLGQVGWPEEEALTLWKTAAESSLDNDGERLFHKWFRKMLCPGCRTIRSRSRGYPQLGLGGLGYCKPDLRCGLYDSPVGKAACLTNDAMAEDRDHLVSLEEVMLVRLYDWHTGREGGVEISLEEKAMLEALLKDNPSRRLRYSQIRIRGRLRPMFSASKDDEISGRLLSEML